MITRKENIGSVYIIIIIFLFVLSGLINIPISYNEYSSFEGDQQLPETIEKVINVNGIVILTFLTILVFLFIYLFDNVKYIIYTLFLLAPIFRQLYFLNLLFTKFLSSILFIIFILKLKYIKYIKQTVPVNFLIGAFIILFGILISTIVNSVSYLPFIRQLLFFFIIFSIHAHLCIFNLSSITKLVSIAAIPVFIDLFIGLFTERDLNLAFAQTTHIFESQSAVGAFLFCTLPFLHAYLFVKYKENVLKYSLIFEILFLFFTLLTGSRGGFLGILIYSVLLRIKKISISKLFLIFLSLFIFAIIIIQIPFFYTIFRIDNPLSQRDLLLILGFDVVRNNILFGTGPGSFSDIALSYGTDNGIVDLMKGGIWGSSTHNIYLDMIIESGLIGLFGLLFIFREVFVQSKKRNGDFPSRISSSLLIAYIIISFFGTKVIMGGSISEGLLLWISLLYIPTLGNKNMNFATS